MKSRRSLAVVVLALAACASSGKPIPSPEPESSPSANEPAPWVADVQRCASELEQDRAAGVEHSVHTVPPLEPESRPTGESHVLGCSLLARGKNLEASICDLGRSRYLLLRERAQAPRRVVLAFERATNGQWIYAGGRIWLGSDAHARTEEFAVRGGELSVWDERDASRDLWCVDFTLRCREVGGPRLDHLTGFIRAPVRKSPAQ
jgi:hypothetical protein